jgi:ATP-binding cassette subfamily F protein 3
MIIQLADLHFGYPGHEIFEGVSFQINPGDRLGLVGPNGAGKSTLMRLLAGELQPDRGQVVRTRGKTLAYMHQSQEFHGHGTLWDTLLEPFEDLLRMRAELAELEQRISESHEDSGLLSRYGTLQEQYDRQDGYTLEVRVRQLAADLGFSEADLERGVETLSGGERGRVELAKAVLLQPDLLLLDEPTNHLDVDAVEHLEERLSSWDAGRAFLVISHDRYFLRAVCKDIVDVEDLDLVRYAGGYEKYLVEREERHQRLLQEYERQQEEIARTEDFIRRNIAGQKTKQAKSRRKMLEKMEVMTRHRDEWQAAGKIGLQFQTGERRGGKEVARAEGVELGYGDGPALVKGLDLTVYRGDRLGIIGPNGAGKSTLLKALLGQVAPRKGMIFEGHEVRVGYFDQKLSGLSEDRSLIEEIRLVRGDFNEDVARAYLARFRFTGDEGFRKVRGLSGGERNRLALAKLMLQPRNVLALDEPTNHLDIPGCEVLEEALREYDGTILVVSHDRYFLDRVVTKILHLDPATGRVEAHAGNYTDWKGRLEAQKERAARQAAEAQAAQQARARQARQPPKQGQGQGQGQGPGPGQAQAKKGEPEADSKQQRMQDRQARKDRDRERERKARRLQQVEAQIAQLEAEAARLRAALVEAGGGDWQRLHAMAEEEQAASAKIKALMAEWEELAAELG